MGGRPLEGRSMDVDWKADLDRWLAPFVAALRHKTRARMCPLYVAGLIGPGDRKSAQPMAARASEVGYDQLHHFVAAGVWDSAPLETALLKEADSLVGDQAGPPQLARAAVQSDIREAKRALSSPDLVWSGPVGTYGPAGPPQLAAPFIWLSVS